MTQVQREPGFRKLQPGAQREGRGVAPADAAGAGCFEPQGRVLRTRPREVPVLAERARAPLRRERLRGGRHRQVRPAAARPRWLPPIQIVDRAHQLPQGETGAVHQAPQQEAQLHVHSAGNGLAILMQCIVKGARRDGLFEVLITAVFVVQGESSK